MSDMEIKNAAQPFDAAHTAAPFTQKELWDFFHESPHSTSKHILILYSLAVGMNAQAILDLGLGATTRVLRMATARTGGVVSSCDADIQRFSHLLQQQDDHWRLFLCASEKLLSTAVGPFDLVVHDAAHDYYQVKMDLDLILPQMRTFGMICVHDVQQVDLAPAMLAAIQDATRNWKVSATLLPFNAGLAIIRIEKGRHPAADTHGGLLPDGRFDTALSPVTCSFSGQTNYAGAKASLPYLIRWKLRKLLMRW